MRIGRKPRGLRDKFESTSHPQKTLYTNGLFVAERESALDLINVIEITL
jgi:hypothetical protein